MNVGAKTAAAVAVNAAGLVLARRLQQRVPVEIHGPQDQVLAGEQGFTTGSTVRIAELFRAGRPLLLFMASGIAVRALSGLPQSKHSDPAVVVVDTAGRHAISLLCGHEGGANDLALRVANVLEAHPVITTGTEAAKRLVLGLGSRRGVSATAVETAVRSALERVEAPLAAVYCAATVREKEDEAGLRSALAALELPLRVFSPAAVRRVAALFPVSAAARHLAVPAVAEPCAFLAADNGELLLRKQAIGPVTVAVARRCGGDLTGDEGG